MFNHVTALVLFVQDFEKMLAFYRDTLELPVAQLEEKFVAFKMHDQDFALLHVTLEPVAARRAARSDRGSWFVQPDHEESRAEGHALREGRRRRVRRRRLHVVSHDPLHSRRSAMIRSPQVASHAGANPPNEAAGRPARPTTGRAERGFEPCGPEAASTAGSSLSASASSGHVSYGSPRHHK